jgi:oligopeptide transport system permease protein
MNAAAGPWRAAGQRLRGRHSALVAGGTLSLLILLAGLGPLASPWPFDVLDWANMGVGPDAASRHWFGTDRLGRDLFVRTLAGTRVSLAIALLATGVSLLIGVTYGAFAGYVGGRLADWMMRVVDVLYALPYVFFVIVVNVVFDRDPVLVFISIGAIGWLTMARMVCAEARRLRHTGYIEAARVAGAPTRWILLRHVLPNLAGTVVVYATLAIPQMILIESFLSFLGIGIQEPLASLGNLIAVGAADMDRTPWMLLFPAGTLVLLVLCFNALGDALRDALDPRVRS